MALFIVTLSYNWFFVAIFSQKSIIHSLFFSCFRLHGLFILYAAASRFSLSSVFTTQITISCSMWNCSSNIKWFFYVWSFLKFFPIFFFFHFMLHCASYSFYVFCDGFMCLFGFSFGLLYSLKKYINCPP